MVGQVVVEGLRDGQQPVPEHPEDDIGREPCREGGGQITPPARPLDQGGEGGAPLLEELDDRAAVTELAASLAPIDALVLTISSSAGLGPLADLDLAELRNGFDEKVIAMLTVLQAALPHLAEQASITLVGAISAHAAMPGTTRNRRRQRSRRVDRATAVRRTRAAAHQRGLPRPGRHTLVGRDARAGPC